MRFPYQAALLCVLVLSSLTYGQESHKPLSESGLPPLELRLKKGPMWMWKRNCLELSVQRTKVSKSPIFLDAMYAGIKIYIYSSLSDTTNALGQDSGEAWMLVYEWTDVVSEPIELAPGARMHNTVCVVETFPIKETGKETIRQVRVQGKLRIVAGYEIPTWKIIDRSQGKGKREYVRTADKANRSTFCEVALEVPIPCVNDIGTPDCFSTPPIFPGEHDVHTFELEPPPASEIQPRPEPILSIDHTLPTKT